MGYYIQTPSSRGKADQIIEMYGADEITREEAKEFVKDGTFGVVCVVQNGPFDAAGYCFNEREWTEFADPGDHRPKRWLIMDKAEAERLSGYKG